MKKFKRYISTKCVKINKEHANNISEIATVNVIKLGKAWASNTINTSIFRCHGLLTLDEKQYGAYYLNKNVIRLFERCLKTCKINYHDIYGVYQIHDSHNSISLGYDRLFHIHVSYDHHVSKFRSRRSVKPFSISDFSDELSSVDDMNDGVTYPSYILPNSSSPLRLIYRKGGHINGCCMIKEFDESKGVWGASRVIIDGLYDSMASSNAYWNTPTTGRDNSLHLSYVWRHKSNNLGRNVNNVDVSYAVSYDGGHEWFTSGRKLYQLPINRYTTEVVKPFDIGTNLINQSGMALDNNNNPHIVYYANDPQGVVQYMHLWFNGRKWLNSIISRRSSSFVLNGAGTLGLPISRPEILISDENIAYVILRADYTSSKFALVVLEPPGYLYNEENMYILYDEAVDFSEPIIDRERWRNNGILSMFVQKNTQAKGDLKVKKTSASISIVDLVFNK